MADLSCSKDDSFVVEGKLALPYRYFAGRTGSRFLLALRGEKKILGSRCPACNKVYVPPRPTCERHVAQQTEWAELSSRGMVAGFTVVRYREPYQPLEPPYVLALVRLDGADTPLVHVVTGVSPAEMRVGLRVKAVFAEKSTSTIMDIDHFAPDESSHYELGRTYDELEPGMSASFSKTISESDVYLFAGISGDFNPVHVNEQYARTTPFGTRIAHGALPQALIAPVLGMKLPGLGTVAVEINVRFKAPTFFGDTITAKATVVEKIEEKRWVKLACEWTNQNGAVVASGWAIVIPPKR
jgi:uncharacterized OB-fold protein/acyl dehydratase